jgi:type I restriction enzyme S subunit
LEYLDLNRVSESSAQPGLSVQKIKKIEVNVPLDGIEQQAIAAVLSDMDAEIQTLEARLTKARAVKEGMMQNLLTGRVRLV